MRSIVFVILVVISLASASPALAAPAPSEETLRKEYAQKMESIKQLDQEVRKRSEACSKQIEIAQKEKREYAPPAVQKCVRDLQTGTIVGYSLIFEAMNVRIRIANLRMERLLAKPHSATEAFKVVEETFKEVMKCGEIANKAAESFNATLASMVTKP